MFPKDLTTNLYSYDKSKNNTKNAAGDMFVYVIAILTYIRLLIPTTEDTSACSSLPHVHVLFSIIVFNMCVGVCLLEVFEGVWAWSMEVFLLEVFDDCLFMVSD